MGFHICWVIPSYGCCNSPHNKDKPLTPPTPIIHEHYSTVQVVEPPKRVLIEEEIWTRLDGCPIVNKVCVDCLTANN